MNARTILLFFAPVLAATFASAQVPVEVTSLPRSEPTAKPTAPDPRFQDVLFFSEERPIVFRLHVQVDGTGHEKVWMDAVRRLHAYLDADKDGQLSATERERGAWLPQLLEQSRTMVARRQGVQAAPTALTAKALATAENVRTADDLVALLRPDFGPMQIQFAGPSNTGPETLFTALDRDGDKTLTKEELEAAVGSLRALDRDDDETIQLQEVQPYRNPYFGGRVANNPQNNGTDQAPFVLLSSHESRTTLVRRLLNRYDRKEKDNALSRSEIGMDPAVYERADGDGDGKLDSDELIHYLREPAPDVELDVRIGKIGQPHIEVLAGSNPTDISARIRKTPAGGLDLVLESEIVELGTSMAGGGIDARQFYSNQFRRLDADNNKYLEMKEIRNNGILNEDAFKMMDRDGDGKLFETEMNAFIDQESDFTKCRTLLSTVDQGRSLFDVLDGDRDRRLSVREVRGLLAKVATWDRNGDGRVALEEVPRNYRLGLARGQSMLSARFGIVTFVDNLGLVTNRTRTSRGIPSWFTKMDRNQDRDLSRREFLGSLAEFNRLDTDHDGLLDTTEAAQAHQAGSPH